MFLFKDIVKIANTVLVDPESTPSLKNAAVECVELWLKLPGAKISDFLPVFSAVFDNISADMYERFFSVFNVQ